MRLSAGFQCWGEVGVPLLPRSLKHHWARERLPDWVAQLLGLSGEATVGELPAMPDISEASRQRLMNFFGHLVRTRSHDIRDLRVLSDVLPIALDLRDLPFRVRTRNCLLFERLLEAKDELQGMSFAEFLRIPAFGVKSLLDFACVTEAAAEQLAQPPLTDASSKPDFQAQLERLIAAAGEPWADLVSTEDPRFRALLPPGRGTFLERVESVVASGSLVECEKLLDSVPLLRSRLAEIENLPLESALADYLESVTRMTGERLNALLARFGWAGDPPATLEVAGRMIGVTRERLRQVEARVTEKLVARAVFMPALTRAIAALEGAAPIAEEDASELLSTRGISKKRFHPKSVIEAARLCGIPSALQLRTVRGAKMVLGTGKEGLARKVASIAIKQCGASGVTNIAEVLDQVAADDIHVSEDEARRLLTNIEGLQFLDDRWFWNSLATESRNRLRNICRKMLSVASPIPLLKIREGLRREYTFRTSSWPDRWPLRVPPLDILRHFLRVHPEFSCDDIDAVRTKAALDYKAELGEVDRVMVEVLRSAPSGVLDRPSIREACLARGVNINSIEMALTYSAVIEHLDVNVWGLRGIDVHVSAIEALRVANAMRPRERRIYGYEWTSDGRIRIAARLPGQVASPVLGIPGAVRRYLADKRFAAVAADGSQRGTIGVSEDGSAYGFGRFLEQAGADEGDFLILEFDLASNQVHLQLAGPDVVNDFRD